MPLLDVKYNFEIISVFYFTNTEIISKLFQCFISNVTTSETEI